MDFKDKHWHFEIGILSGSVRSRELWIYWHLGLSDEMYCQNCLGQIYQIWFHSGTLFSIFVSFIFQFISTSVFCKKIIINPQNICMQFGLFSPRNTCIFAYTFHCLCLFENNFPKCISFLCTHSLIGIYFNALSEWPRVTTFRKVWIFSLRLYVYIDLRQTNRVNIL